MTNNTATQGKAQPTQSQSEGPEVTQESPKGIIVPHETRRKNKVLLGILAFWMVFFFFVVIARMSTI
mgnify:CR=1 FL=1